MSYIFLFFCYKKLRETKFGQDSDPVFLFLLEGRIRVRFVFLDDGRIWLMFLSDPDPVDLVPVPVEPFFSMGLDADSNLV